MIHLTLLALLAGCAGDKDAATAQTTATGQATGTSTGTGTGSGTGTGTGTGSGTGTGTGSGTGTGTGTGSTTSTYICAQAATTAGYLDALQTPNDDMVIFCHMDATGLVLMNISFDDCLDHIQHTQDILPTTICDSR